MTEEQTFEQHLLYPVGTQVVLRRAITNKTGAVIRQQGSVGVIVELLPEEVTPYAIRFADGGEISLSREDIVARKYLRQFALSQMRSEDHEALYQYVIYRCIVGSRAYGLDHDDSDTDRRGIYLAPAEVQWSLAGAPEQLERDETQEVYWELQKFLMMALKANPNVLECLYSPLVETATPLATELVAMRSMFLSRLVYYTYNGYVFSQFKKLEQDLRVKGKPNWKHAMHLIRLLISGVTILREGFVPLRMDAYRERLLAVRRAEMPWAEVNAWRLSLHKEFDKAFATTTLPEAPDVARADAFLIQARRSML